MLCLTFLAVSFKETTHLEVLTHIQYHVTVCNSKKKEIITGALGSVNATLSKPQLDVASYVAGSLFLGF